MRDTAVKPRLTRVSPLGAARVEEKAATRQRVAATSAVSGDDALTGVTAAVLGLGTSCSVYANGGVTVGHCVALVIGPVLLAAARRHKSGRVFLWHLVLWASATVFTTVTVHDSLHHTVYALSRPLTVALSFCAAMWAFQQSRWVKNVYIVSIMAGLFGGIALVPTPGLAADPWKYGFGPVVSFAAALLVAAPPLRKRRLLQGALMTLTAVTSLVLGFRSEFLIVCVATAVSVLVSRRSAGRTFRRCMLLGVGLGTLCLGIYVGYSSAASSGLLGQQQKVKWEKESTAEGGLLFGARPAFVASTAVIEDSPLFGRGVRPEVSQETQSAFMQRMRDIGITVHTGLSNYYFGHGLYLHSVIFQLWAETGLLVLPGLLFPVWLVVRALVAAVGAGSRCTALVFSMLVGQLGWDLLFSPWPRLEGVYLGTAAAAAIVYAASRQRGLRS